METGVDTRDFDSHKGRGCMKEEEEEEEEKKTNLNVLGSRSCRSCPSCTCRCFLP